MINLQNVVLFVLSYFVIPRLTFLPKSVHTLLVIFGPFLLPKVLNIFNTARATSRSVPVRSTPLKVKRALNLLFLSAVVCLVLTLPHFAPENIFLRTQSRVQIDSNVLFTRLRLLRRLTGEDEILRSKFSSFQNKLIYLTYGPDTLANCIWCTTADGDDTKSYFLYSLPKIITSHIAHLAVLGLATSSLVGAEGSRFRTHATIAGLALMVVETWYLGTYDITINKRAKTFQDLDFVHWRVRAMRFLSFTLVDGIFGVILWLTSTNRWLAKPTSLAERLEMTTRGVEETMHKVRALTILSNSINRDPTLRAAKEGYWRTEGEFMAEAVQDEAVVAEINKVLGKLDMAALESHIGRAADTLLEGLDDMNASQNLSASGLTEVSSS